MGVYVLKGGCVPINLPVSYPHGKTSQWEGDQGMYRREAFTLSANWKESNGERRPDVWGTRSISNSLH